MKENSIYREKDIDLCRAYLKRTLNFKVKISKKNYIFWFFKNSSKAFKCFAKASRPFCVTENVVLGRRPMNCFWHWIYPNSSRLLVWLARFPSVRSSKFLRVTKSTDSLTIKMDMIPRRALLSKALFIFSRYSFMDYDLRLVTVLPDAVCVQLYNKSIFLPQYEVIRNR